LISHPQIKKPPHGDAFSASTWEGFRVFGQPYLIYKDYYYRAYKSRLYLAHESSWQRAAGYGPLDGQAFDNQYVKVLHGTDAGLEYAIKNTEYEIGTTELEFFETAFSSEEIPGKIIKRDRDGSFAGGGSGEGGIVVVPPQMIIPPHVGGARNLALVVLGHEVTGPADVSTIIDWISATVRAGQIENLYIASGDAEYFGLASIAIAAGNDAGGAFSAALAPIGGGSYGRNLDFVLVAKNPYLDKNGNAQPHVFVQSRHALSNMSSPTQGGHYMNPSATNAGGYASSKGRAFVNTEVKAALLAAGIPVNDTTKILNISRRSANGGASATGTDIITDNVTLATEYEALGSKVNSNPTYEPVSGQSHMEYYGNAASRIKRKADGTAVYWWAASPWGINNSVGSYCTLDANGNALSGVGTNGYASQEYGIAPAFAIG